MKNKFFKKKMLGTLKKVMNLLIFYDHLVLIHRKNRFEETVLTK